jgi:uncharacterized membrane protein YraQ (UPF0718 family)
MQLTAGRLAATIVVAVVIGVIVSLIVSHIQRKYINKGACSCSHDKPDVPDLQIN